MGRHVRVFVDDRTSDRWPSLVNPGRLQTCPSLLSDRGGGRSAQVSIRLEAPRAATLGQKDVDRGDMRSWNPTPQSKEKEPQVHGVFCFFCGMSNQARCPEGLDGIFSGRRRCIRWNAVDNRPHRQQLQAQVLKMLRSRTGTGWPRVDFK